VGLGVVYLRIHIMTNSQDVSTNPAPCPKGERNETVYENCFLVDRYYGLSKTPHGRFTVMPIWNKERYLAIGKRFYSYLRTAECKKREVKE